MPRWAQRPTGSLISWVRFSSLYSLRVLFAGHLSSYLRLLVVEITLPGIESLGWQFYIIWTVFNGAFVPIIYFFYPETAGRSLEDLDRYFHDQPSLFVNRDKDAISSKRPQKYIEHEEGEIRRHSSVSPAAMNAAAAKHRQSVLNRESGSTAMGTEYKEDRFAEKEMLEKV